MPNSFIAKTPMITAENAAKLQRKAVISRHLRAEEKRVAQREAEIAAISQQLPEYQARRLARVRVQLDRLDVMMMEEDDPAKLDRIASAQSRVADQEQKLAGRPNPGSLKPTTSKPTRHTQVEPIESIRLADPNEPNG